VDRVAAAKERLSAAAEIARQAGEAGPPCSDCRYRTILGNCRNPAYAQPRFEASSGIYEEAFITPIVSARSDNGLCGPEGLLFEPHSAAVEVAKSAWGGVKIVYFGLVGVIAALGLILTGH
jgi:hypothetical protein